MFIIKPNPTQHCWQVATVAAVVAAAPTEQLPGKARHVPPMLLTVPPKIYDDEVVST